MKYLPELSIFRARHKLKFPQGYNVMNINDIATLASGDRLDHFAGSLLKDGKTEALRNPQLMDGLRASPQHQMIVLMLPPESDPYVGHLITEARRLDSLDQITEKHLVCFSSLHLMYQTFLARHNYANNVMACIDSSHGADSGGGKLQSCGYVTMQRRGRGGQYRRGYTPIVFARILEENTCAAIMMLASVSHAVRLLFGVILDVKGGLISDHATSFVNAYKICFPGSPVGQCFPHIIRKVKDQSGTRKNGTPGYLKYVRDRDFLDEAHLDVLCMGHTMSDEMKKTYTSLCLQGWEDSGETSLGITFKGSYVDSEPHSHFRFNEFNNPGDTPQSNSLERGHLTWKGCKQFEGYCKFGLSLNQMLTREYPRLVNLVSQRSEMLDCAMKINDLDALINDQDFLYQVSKLSEKDFFRRPNGTYLANNTNGYRWANHNDKKVRKANEKEAKRNVGMSASVAKKSSIQGGFLGYTIDKQRLENWSNAYRGIFPANDPARRQEYWEAGTSLCFLQKKVARGQKDPNILTWHCSCHTFWSTTACIHTYYLQYGKVPNLSSTKSFFPQHTEEKLMSSRYTFKSGFDTVTDEN
jgi:hypothetical protein